MFHLYSFLLPLFLFISFLSTFSWIHYTALLCATPYSASFSFTLHSTLRCTNVMLCNAITSLSSMHLTSMCRNLIYSGGKYRLSRRTLRLHLRQGWQGPLPRHTTHEACVPFVRTRHVRAAFSMLQMFYLRHNFDSSGQYVCHYLHENACRQPALSCTVRHCTTLCKDILYYHLTL